MNLLKILAIPTIAIGLPMAAQDSDSHIKVDFDARVDYSVEMPDNDGETLSGFHGRYLNVRIDGSINSEWSYSWRQRMNKFADISNDAFSATDWVYVRYQPNDNWAFSGGKMVVLVGGYEYDAAPIDMYYSTVFWNNFACYQFGATATYISDDQNHQVSFQVTNSPYTGTTGKGYAYNLFWSGNMGALQTLWSANMMEYVKGKFVNYVSLGNKLTAGDFSLELDFMNRTISSKHFFDHNFSVVSRAAYAVKPWVTVFVKGGYDEFKLDPASSAYTDGPLYGGGMEIYPLKSSHDLRLHAFYDHHTNVGGVNTDEFNIGATWRVNIFKR